MEKKKGERRKEGWTILEEWERKNEGYENCRRGS
jgi:hypothetical protein